MDLRFTPEENAFAAEIRASGSPPTSSLPPAFASLDDEIAWGRAWQAQLAADRWVGIQWPREYGGRERDARSRWRSSTWSTPEPGAAAGEPGRHQPRRSDAAGPRHRRAEAALAAARSSTPSEIWCQLFSEPDAGSDLAVAAPRGATPRRRRLGAHGPEGVDVVRAVRAVGHLPGPHRPRRAEAPRHLVPGGRHDRRRASRSGRCVQITGEAEFNEVFLDDVFVPDDHLVGELHDGLGGRQHDTGPRAGHATSRSRSRSCTRCTSTSCARSLASADVLDDAEVADGLAQAFVELRVLRLHNWRTLSRLGRGLEPGPESSWVKLAWTDMTQHLSDAALDVLGAEAAARGTRGRVSGCGREAASIAGGTSEVQRTIIGERILGLPA